eukprot:609349-Prorocentrum_minimum.AAC.1
MSFFAPGGVLVREGDLEVGLHAAIKPSLSHLITGELNSPTNYLRTTYMSVSSPTTRELSRRSAGRRP